MSIDIGPTAPPAQDAGPSPHRVSIGQVIGVVLAMTVVLGTVFVAFALPAVSAEPHRVPIGVAGPAAAADQVRQGLDRAVPEGFEVTGFGSEQALRDAVLDRDSYGGLVLGSQGTKIVIATAASPVVAQVITTLGGKLAAGSGAAPQVQDIKPLPADDPRGAGMAAAALPLAIGGLLPAIALTRRFPGRTGTHIAAASAFALVAGIGVTAILKYWFGSVDGDYWPVALGMTLGIAAITFTVLGLESLAGLPGLGIGAALIVLLGNPLSGVATAPEMLPSGWGTFGQFLPPGANGTLLRSTAFFDGAGAAQPVLVLCGWAILGLVLCAISLLYRNRKDRVGGLGF
jgi:hypothetical protein